MGLQYRTCQQIATLEYGSVTNLEFQRNCVLLDTDAFTVSSRNCGGGDTTPPLYSFEVSLYSEESPDPTYDNGTIVASIGIWIGFELHPGGDLKCIWAGQEEAGVCVNVKCADSAKPTYADVRNLSEEIADEMEDYYEDQYLDAFWTAALVVVIAGVVYYGATALGVSILRPVIGV